MRWILHDAIAGQAAPTNVVSSALMGSAALSVAAAFALIAMELVFPVVLVRPDARLPMAFAAVALHSATWLTLGLDYWAWSLTALLVLGLSSRSVAPAGRGR